MDPCMAATGGRRGEKHLETVVQRASTVWRRGGIQSFRAATSPPPCLSNCCACAVRSGPVREFRGQAHLVAFAPPCAGAALFLRSANATLLNNRQGFGDNGKCRLTGHLEDSSKVLFVWGDRSTCDCSSHSATQHGRLVSGYGGSGSRHQCCEYDDTA